MRLKVITPPATEPLTLDEAKQHLRIAGSDDDVIISSLISQAREYCEDYQGKKYITQTLEGYLDEFPDDEAIEFTNCSPVQSITKIEYRDTNGNWNTFDGANYELDTVSFVNKIDLGYDKEWPDVDLWPNNAVKITFVAGYGDATAVPEAVKWAMVLHMRILYDDYRPEERQKLEQARDALLSMNRVVPV